jgi:hypothetical protein
VRPAEAVPSAEARADRLFGVVAGAGVEQWSSQVFGAVGPRGGLRVTPLDETTFSLVAAVAWATGRPRGLHAWVAELSGGVDRRLLDGLVETGLAVGAARYEVASPTEPRLDDAAFSGFAELRARLVLGDPTLRVSMGPFLRARAGAVVTRLDDVEVLRVPLISGGLTLLVDLGL